VISPAKADHLGIPVTKRATLSQRFPRCAAPILSGAFAWYGIGGVGGGVIASGSPSLAASRKTKILLLFIPTERDRIRLRKALGVDVGGRLALDDPGDDRRIEEGEPDDPGHVG